MNRNITKNALVLSVKATAQDNRSVCVLTKDGIEYSTLFGGPKSRLCGSISPWNSGTMFFYNNAEKQSSKITDFDVKKYHPTFRENLFKSFAAALASEVVLKSKCGGSPENAFILLNGFLDGMDLCDEEKSRLGLLRFLWRYLDLLGVRPLTDSCCRCGQEFFKSHTDAPAPTAQTSIISNRQTDAKRTYLFATNVAHSLEAKRVSVDSQRSFQRQISVANSNSTTTRISSSPIVEYDNKAVLYSSTEGGFVCGECFSPSEVGTRISANALFYLDAAGKENMAAARNLTLERGDYNILKSFLYEAVENALGLKLKTLVSGSGIL